MYGSNYLQEQILSSKKRVGFSGSIGRDKGDLNYLYRAFEKPGDIFTIFGKEIINLNVKYIN